MIIGASRGVVGFIFLQCNGLHKHSNSCSLVHLSSFCRAGKDKQIGVLQVKYSVFKPSLVE